jgi:hypothetical protein
VAEGVTVVKGSADETFDDLGTAPKHLGHLATPVDAEKFISLSVPVDEH